MNKVIKEKNLAELMSRVSTDNPSPKDITTIQELLKTESTLWRSAGDVVQYAADNIIDRLSSTPLIKESIKAGHKQVKDALGYKKAGTLEKLLIENVAMCWLRWNEIEYRYTAVTAESIPIARADYWERKLNAANRRFLRALETLARVRKLTQPSNRIQLNIAKEGSHQLNMAKLGE